MYEFGGDGAREGCPEVCVVLGMCVNDLSAARFEGGEELAFKGRFVALWD